MNEIELSREDLVQACARYRMALEAIVLLGFSSHHAQGIAKAALEGVAPTTKVDQPVPVSTSEPWI